LGGATPLDRDCFPHGAGWSGCRALCDVSVTRQPLPTLEPCPLDGQPVGFWLLGNWWIIRCPQCGLKLEKHLPVGEVAALWNRRFNIVTPTTIQEGLFNDGQ